jgi:hypothetical protein
MSLSATTLVCASPPPPSPEQLTPSRHPCHSCCAGEAHVLLSIDLIPLPPARIFPFHWNWLLTRCLCYCLAEPLFYIILQIMSSQCCVCLLPRGDWLWEHMTITYLFAVRIFVYSWSPFNWLGLLLIFHVMEKVCQCILSWCNMMNSLLHAICCDNACAMQYAVFSVHVLMLLL